MQQTALCDQCRKHALSLRWALRETDFASSRVPPGADGPDDVVLLNNDGLGQFCLVQRRQPPVHGPEQVRACTSGGLTLWWVLVSE